MNMQKFRFLLDQAREYYNKEQYDSAESILNELLHRSPGFPLALKNLTVLQFKRGVEVDGSTRAKLVSLHGLYDQGYEEYTARLFHKCLETFTAARDLASTLVGFDHYLKALDDLITEAQLENEVIENNRLIDGLLSEGKTSFEQKLYDQCIERMMSVLAIDPGHTEAVQFIKEATELRKD